MDDRKKSHINLTAHAKTTQDLRDKRFFYEPLWATHPRDSKAYPSQSFLGKEMAAPLWISSMTGGCKEAIEINQRLARASAEFGLGMGLGSCRILLQIKNWKERKELLKQFHLRPLIGDKSPFYANLGIAQIEHIFKKASLSSISGRVKLIEELVEDLECDGLIVHLNYLQEWIQREGDRFEVSPLESLEHFLEYFKKPVVVKEVGQGFGPESLKKLMSLPLKAIDFGAFGGTNFSKIELMRKKVEASEAESIEPLVYLGHSAEEMVDFINDIKSQGFESQVKEFIISGGVKTFLDGHYLMNKLGYSSVYAQAGPFLHHAQKSYDALANYIDGQIKGLVLAKNALKLRPSEPSTF